MTAKHYDLSPRTGDGTDRLVFEWDEEAGTVTGPGAGRIMLAVGHGRVSAHPLPWGVELGAQPLRSKRDMAAIVGLAWHLPPDLADHYPKYEEPDYPPDALEPVY